MASDSDYLDLFRDLVLFEGASDEELALIDSLSDEVHVPAGRELLKAGDIGREFVLIVKGQVDIATNGEKVAELGPGDYFGELALLDDRPRNATATASTDLELQVIDRRGFQSLLEDSPTLTLNLLKATARRLADRDAELATLRASTRS